jgi:proline dehydrogenase
MLSRAIAGMLPIVPVSVVRQVSKRYIAGETLKEALDKVRFLNDLGYAATLDLLGEDVTNAEEASAATTEYVKVLDGIGEAGLDTNVSLKPTNHGLMVSEACCEENVLRIVEAAARWGNFVRMDMESSEFTQVTLDVYKRVLERHDQVGIVLQAYLRRTADDVQDLIALNARRPVNVRICKGIYREPAEIAFRRKRVIRESFSSLTKDLLKGGVYVGIASHDKPLLADLDAWLDRESIPKDRFEFQALLGVPVTSILNRYVEGGRRVRLYVPYGEHWYGYSVRRLRENPAMAGHVFRAMFKKTSYG